MVVYEMLFAARCIANNTSVVSVDSMGVGTLWMHKSIGIFVTQPYVYVTTLPCMLYEK